MLRRIIAWLVASLFAILLKGTFLYIVFSRIARSLAWDGVTPETIDHRPFVWPSMQDLVSLWPDLLPIPPAMLVFFLLAAQISRATRIYGDLVFMAAGAAAMMT